MIVSSRFNHFSKSLKWGEDTLAIVIFATMVILPFTEFIARIFGILSIPASYALSRYNFKGNKDIAFFLLSTRMVPPIVMIIPFFFIFNYINLVDTLLGLILMSVMINAPVCIWIL